MDAKLISAEELADYLGVPVTTVRQWSHRGTGPKTITVGRWLRYRPEDVDEWVLEQMTVRRNGAPRIRKEAGTGW
jgi:excisionase family DNA binding protein